MSESPSDEEERFDEIVADFLDAVSAGEPVDEDELLAAHPEFASALKAFFSDHRRLGGMLEIAPHDDATLPVSLPDRSVAAAASSHFAGSSGISQPEHYGVDPEKCIADYELLERLAEGGMGVVYKARQLSLNRTVALKMIRAGEFADAEEIRRFRVEAEAAAKLTHPGIVPIYQIGEDKGQHFFSMALVEGPSLADLIREQPMKPRQAAEYVTKVARAVQFAHDQGIIHRDIKPANVLVDPDDQPKVTDFGLAKQITSDHQLTMSGQILGTASYMSPEQAAGKAITPLADVYSLGALLYALLTKQPPFTGANPVDILLDVLSKDPASPSSLNITLSRDLETICMRCLEKDPRRRYASAETLAEDLDRFLDGTPILARPISHAEKWVRWCQRRPAVATAIFLSIMLCLASVAYVVKEGDTRFWGSMVNAPQDLHSLAEQARSHYALLQSTADTPREQLLWLAGQAMLQYDAGNDQASQSQYQSLADALDQALQDTPHDPALQSALADCLLQLARFRIPPHNPRDRKASLVAEADVKQVTQWLKHAARLLGELQSAHPDNKLLAARRATVRVSMQKLPASFSERSEHLSAAGQISDVWDETRGAIRFAWDIPWVADQAEPADDIKRLETQAKNGGLDDRLRLAHAYAEHQQPVLASVEYQAVLDHPGLNPLAYQQVFQDLAQLAAHQPSAVEVAVAKHWPTDPLRFYHAMLGIRFADVE